MKRALISAFWATAILAACANDELNLGYLGEPSADAGSADVAPSPPVDSGEVPPDAARPAICGNGTVEPGEECDDGNTSAGDGCAPGCTRESAGPGDACSSAIAITLPPSVDNGPRKVTLTGTTTGKHAFYAGSCGGTSASDAVYTLLPDADGMLKVSLSASFDAVLHARGSCEDASTEAACNDAPGGLGGESLLVPVQSGKPLAIFVDGYGTASGDFTLDVEARAAACGDGVAVPPEACDDGNNVAGDGCSPTCTFEELGAPAACPGQGIALTGVGNAPRTISLSGNTGDSLIAGQPISTATSLGTCISPGPNVVYQFRSDIDGALEVKLYAEYSGAVLYARSECRATDVGDGAELACRAPDPSGAPLVLKVPVTASASTFVIVDSNKVTGYGTYRLDATITPAECGNDVVEGSEACDDGNNTDGDGCSATCQVEPPPATVDTCPGTLLELVPDGSKVVGVATASTLTLQPNYNGTCAGTSRSRDAVYRIRPTMSGMLTATVTPVGRVATAVYAQTTCGTQSSQLGCAAGNPAVSPSITVPATAGQDLFLVVSGNSNVTPNEGTFTLRASISPGQCGNGIVEGGEACDDGNLLTGDGCNASCALETPPTNHTCAAAGAIALTETTPGVTWEASVYGGTTNLTNSQVFSPASCPSAGNNAFYTVTAPADGVLSAKVNARFAASIGFRADGTCPPSASPTSPMTCTQAPANVPTTLAIPITQGKRYYLIVDGTTVAAKGPFNLDVKVDAPRCGDEVLSPGEGCDDGNLTAGDGCSATCTLENLAGVASCPGYAIPLSSGPGARTGTVTVSTRTLGSSQSGTCGGSGKEAVFVVTPPIAGTLTASLEGLDYSAVLYARGSCSSAGSELACSADIPPAVTPTRNITLASVTAGTPYYLFVDGYNGASGVGVLQVTVTP